MVIIVRLVVVMVVVVGFGMALVVNLGQITAITMGVSLVFHMLK